MPPQPPQRSPHSEAGPHGAPQVVHAAEDFVGHAIDAAERSLAARFGQHGLNLARVGVRLFAALALIAYFVFGTAVLVTRYYVLPHIDDWRSAIETNASAALHAPVSIGRIEADWQGLRPHLALFDVALKENAENGGATVLALPQVDVVIAWTTLLVLQPRLHDLDVIAPEIAIKRLADQRYAVAGIVIDPKAASSESAFLDWVLAQRHIAVRDARVHFVDEALAARPGDTSALTELTDVNFELERGLTGHHFALQVRPPPQLAAPIDVRGEFTSPWGVPRARVSAWSGRVYAQFDYADLVRVDAIAHLVPAPARIDSARGALRAWIDFQEMHLSRMRADVALTDVRAQLRPELAPLRLNSVQGRITQTISSDPDGDSVEYALNGVQLSAGTDLRLPPTDVVFRTTHPRHPAVPEVTEQTYLQVSRVVLADWSRLATQIPLPENWRALIERTAAQGTLEDLRAGWGGPAVPPPNFAVHAHFSDLGFTLGANATERMALAPEALSPEAMAAGAGASDAPAQGPPAWVFENLAGTIDLDQDSGNLRLDATNTRLRLPPLADDAPVALDTLAARVRWSGHLPDALRVDLDSFSFANEDLEVSASGSYAGAARDPGQGARLDLSGHVVRASVAAVPAYLPRLMPGPTRTWLKGALLGGSVREGAFYLHGDPARFPFADPKSGEFHAALHVQEGKLDFAPRAAVDPQHADDTTLGPIWPYLTGVDADVVFDRNLMTINGRHARAYGFDLSGVTVRLPQLDRPEQHLAIEGQGNGPLADLLHYCATSPVNGWTGGWFADADAAGAARLRIKLDIPLAKANDSLVSGVVTFRNDNLVLRHDIAPFSNLSGDLSFSQRGVHFAGLTAGFLGGDVRLFAETQPDGTLEIRGSGIATPQGTKRQVEPASLRRLLDHMRGAFRYSATLAVHHSDTSLQIDSDLQGLAADLPEPFRKTAGELRALHIEVQPVAGATPARDVLRATLDTQLTVELHRILGGAAGPTIERGMVSIGARASVPDNGVLLFYDHPKLDIDRWQRLIAPAPAALPAGADAGAAPAPSAPARSEASLVDHIGVHTAELIVENKTLTNVSFTAKRDPESSWLADIDSDQVSGSIRWVGGRAGSQARLAARLAKLAIPERDRHKVTSMLDAAPTEFPAVDIIAEQFELGSKKLGHLEIEAQNFGSARGDSWVLQKLLLNNPDGRLSATGNWQKDEAGTRRMQLKGTVSFTNAGAWLGRLGVSGIIKNGTGKLEGELSWRGVPYPIDLKSLAGKMKLQAEKGQFLRADFGVGRLFSAMSLQSIANRVTGDFRDVFSQGFAFDTMTASAVVTDGSIATDDLIMKGVGGALRVKGDTNLQTEALNLEMVVIPEINAGTAALAYSLVNPAIGLGYFIGSILLRKPLSKAFTNIYQINGTWSDPQVKRVDAPAAAPAAAQDSNAG